VSWVDDKPDNNVFERSSLGLSFVLAKSTEEALEKAARHRFDVIISDMGRPPDQRAGYALLEKLRACGDRTPFIIYAGSNAPGGGTKPRRGGLHESRFRALSGTSSTLSAARIERHARFCRLTLFACFARAVRVFFGNFEMVFLRLAAAAAFLMFRRAAVFCLGVVMRRKVRTPMRGCTRTTWQIRSHLRGAPVAIARLTASSVR
jgi:CheY-like chemotaxis protein